MDLGQMFEDFLQQIAYKWSTGGVTSRMVTAHEFEKKILKQINLLVDKLWKEKKAKFL